MATVDLGKVAIKHKGNWSSATTYEALDYVYYATDGCGYIALASSTNVTPGTDATKWALSVQAGATGESAVKSITTHTSSETSALSLAWDSIHVFPEMSSLTFTLASVPQDSTEHQIIIIFDTPSSLTGFTLTEDANILWANGIQLPQQLAASTRYEIDILSSSMIAVYVGAPIPQE